MTVISVLSSPKRTASTNFKNSKKEILLSLSNTIIEYATGAATEQSRNQPSRSEQTEIAQLPRLQMLQYDQIDASFLPDPAASIAMNAGTGL